MTGVPGKISSFLKPRVVEYENAQDIKEKGFTSDEKTGTLNNPPHTSTRLEHV